MTNLVQFSHNVLAKQDDIGVVVTKPTLEYTPALEDHKNPFAEGATKEEKAFAKEAITGMSAGTYKADDTEGDKTVAGIDAPAPGANVVEGSAVDSGEPSTNTATNGGKDDPKSKDSKPAVAAATKA